MSKQDISVVICAYTEMRWNDLIAAVASVKQQTLSPKEIIVVIDHNQPLLTRIREQMPDVLAIANKEEQGLSGARNSGIEVTTSSIIAFLDDDASAAPDWLQLLYEGCANTQVLGIGGAVLPSWVENEPRWLPEEFYWVVGCSYQGMPESVSVIRNPIGASIAFRREVFEKVGGFRSGIGRIGTRPIGCEETELCIRARQHWPHSFFLYHPQAYVSHRVPLSRTNWRYFYSRCYSEGLSKAAITRFVGVQDSLASERIYTLQVLPKAVVRYIADALIRHDVYGFQRAGAIILGLVITTLGYAVGKTFSRVGVVEDKQKRAHRMLVPN